MSASLPSEGGLVAGPVCRSRRVAAWLPWALFVSVAAAVVVVGNRPRPALPQSPTQLVARLEEAGVQFHVVPVSRNTQDLDNGLFLCEQERSWEELPLARSGSWGDQWAGVVHVQRRPDEELTAYWLADWGRFGATVGGVVVFGDPAIIGRIKTALGLSHQGRGKPVE
jgi:hypothetical protein